jgi:DNA-binding NtrC family response regulator
MSNNKSILIIDDDKFILDVFSRVLKNQGYNVDTAETGQKALEKLKTKKFDLAIIDMILPDTNGTSLIPKMNEIQPEIKKIVLTGYPSAADSNKTKKQGVNAYLIKPVKSEKIIETITKSLKQQKQQP